LAQTSTSTPASQSIWAGAGAPYNRAECAFVAAFIPKKQALSITYIEMATDWVSFCELSRPLRLNFECCLAKTCLNICRGTFVRTAVRNYYQKGTCQNQRPGSRSAAPEPAITQPSARQTLVPQPGQLRPSSVDNLPPAQHEFP
jgi:hypothetical protein